MQDVLFCLWRAGSTSLTTQLMRCRLRRFAGGATVRTTATLLSRRYLILSDWVLPSGGCWPPVTSAAMRLSTRGIWKWTSAS